MLESLTDKHRQLTEALRELGGVVVAFSGGVDSTLVLRLALDTLGRENVLAATGVSPSLPQRELDSVRELASRLGAHLELVETDELADERYRANHTDRCYFCKTELYTKLLDLARRRGLAAVVNGVILDDTTDLRPGVQAARDRGVRPILAEARMGKDDVRELARRLGVPNWSKPALACLSSRIPFGTPVTIRRLRQVEQAEAFLYERGFEGFRVRHHEELARIEVMPQDLPRLLAEPLRSDLVAHLKALGYTYVTVDLQGFRSGSANEATGRR